MSSFAGLGCVVRWSDGQLELSNGLFSRKWIWKDGRLKPMAFAAFGTHWRGTGDGEAVTSSEDGVDPEISVEEVLGGVGEPHLLVTFSDGPAEYQFKLWEGLAGYAGQLRTEAGVQATKAEAAKIGSDGVEIDEPIAGQPTPHGALEAFEIPGGHWRLLAPEFRDQTDVHGELVGEREYLVHPCEWDLKLRGNLFVLEEVLRGHGLALVKHSPLPDSRTLKSEADFRLSRGSSIALSGHEEGDWWGVFAYEGGAYGRTAAIHAYQRQWRKYHPTCDGLMLSNTWGDRGRDAHLSPEFMSREVEAAARLGVDIVQIDDGWQRGTTANSAQAKEKGGVWNGFWASDDRFWDVNLERFPDGIEGLISAAAEHGMKFGLWFAPDSSRESQNWERDADAILKLHRELGINFFKIDALKLHTRLGEERARKFFEKVLRESSGAVTFDQDITAEDRFGPFGLVEPGPLFVENRYTDWRRYWPHHTLRVGWQLSKWVDPVRLRLEWLNVTRNQDKYEGDPLAPINWRPDALFATVLPFAPLGWFEVQNLPESYFELAGPLIETWKTYREELQRCEMTPIGSAPDGVSWTGFYWTSEKVEYALIFRELSERSNWQVDVPSECCRPGEVLGGQGSGRLGGGVLEVRIPEKLGFVWLRWEMLPESYEE